MTFHIIKSSLTMPSVQADQMVSTMVITLLPNKSLLVLHINLQSHGNTAHFGTWTHGGGTVSKLTLNSGYGEESTENCSDSIFTRLRRIHLRANS